MMMMLMMMLVMIAVVHLLVDGFALEGFLIFEFVLEGHFHFHFAILVFCVLQCGRIRSAATAAVCAGTAAGRLVRLWCRWNGRFGWCGRFFRTVQHVVVLVFAFVRIVFDGRQTILVVLIAVVALVRANRTIVGGELMLVVGVLMRGQW